MKLYNMLKVKILSIILLLTAMGVSAQTWQIGSPNAASVTATLSGGTLTISGTGTMQNWISYSDVPWYGVKDNIKSLVINNGVANIGSYAFYMYGGLTGTLTIPNSVTSIGSFAFYGCSGLTGTLTIPNLVTTIGSAAFQMCSGLTNITIPNSVTFIGSGGVFAMCSSLTSINVDAANPAYSSQNGVLFNKDKTTLLCCPGGKTGTLAIPNSVTNIGESAFFDCSGLTGALTIPNSVTYIGSGAFLGCSGLTGALTIPNSVTSIGLSAFNGCSGLTGSLIIPNSVTYIDLLTFYKCSGLTGTLTIPNSVTSIGYNAFDGCSGFTSLIIPNSVTSIGTYAFQNCNGLSDVTVSWNTPLSIDNTVFANITLSNVKLHIPTGMDNIYASAPIWQDFHIALTKTQTWQIGTPNATDITATLDENGTLTISGTGQMQDWSFTNNPPWYNFQSNIRSLIIKSGVTNIGNYALYGCSNLTGILTIPNSITSIGDSAFGYCGFTGALGADLNSQTDVEYNTLNVNQVLGNMDEKRVGMKLLILDACRDNPFKRSWVRGSEEKGLAGMNAPRGTYIAFAASPGFTAQDGANYNLKNGVFTYFLKREILKAGLSIDEIFNNVTGDVSTLTNEQQTPFKNSSLTKTFYFIPPTESPLVLLGKANTFFANKQYKEALSLYEQVANTGNSDAQNKVGNCYYNGWGVTQDYAQAVEWYKKAADQGSDAAQNNLGFCYDNGFGTTKDIDQAINWYKRAADQGNINAQQELARLQKAVITGQISQANTYYGNKQYSSAFSLYKQLADAGNVDADAQNKLGNSYYNGWGVKQDYAQAVEWYKKAADQGNADAQYNLGLCYENGNDVTKDMNQATEWYKKAAGQGNTFAQQALERLKKPDLATLIHQADSCYNNKLYNDAFPLYKQITEENNANADAQNKLGKCYYNGYGITQDYKQAAYWFTKAADRGEANAQTNLGICYQNGSGVAQDYKQAVNWYKKAIDKGDANAQTNLGVCFYNGWGVKQDYAQAVSWYKKAADQGNAIAQYNLGTCYEDGNGVAKDNTQAAFWYRKAAEQGDEDAKKALERLEGK